MLELTISEKEGNCIILGIDGNVVKYKKVNGDKINLNPFDLERVVTYSINGEQIPNMHPKIGYSPVIIKNLKQEQYCPGKIIEIKEVEQT